MFQMLIAARETYGKKDRPGPPFTNCYVNIFGIVLKEGRKELKRCAELFPRVASRVFNIENTYNKDKLLLRMLYNDL